MESTPSITANPQQSKRLRANVNANPSIQFANPAPSRPAPPLHAGNLDSQPAEDAAQSVADNSAAPVRVSSGTVAGMAISKPDPIYPAIAKAAHIQGAVILHAIISKQGTIEQLSIVSGPPMLANAARDAVQRWRYRPYLLNGEPVEVETSITVNFTFGGG